MVPVPEAIRMVMQETARILLRDKKPNPNERISLSSTPLSTLLHCTLDEEIVMTELGYPPYNASIMDGYAIRTGEFVIQDAMLAATNNSWTHRVVEKVYAGDTKTALKGGDNNDTLPSACYITTGAVVPQSFNCVVPIEECDISSCTSNIRIRPSANLNHHQWIRPVGCDIPPSTVVLPKGHSIDPVAIGLAKQSGVEYINVKRRTRVGVLSTGNELIVEMSDDKEAQRGKIPDVNRPVLLSILATSTFQNICEPIDLGIVRDDDIDTMVETFETALERCDVIITTGGVSMGETDIIERVLVDRCGGNLHFGRMHMKPGKPTTFVTISRPHKMNGNSDNIVKLVFALPGNPCSAAVCTYLLVKPCLDLYFHGIDHNKSFTMMDNMREDQQLEEIVNSSFVHPEIEAQLSHDIKLDAKRPEYHRVVLLKNISHNNETYQASSTGVQRSSRLMSLRDAQGLLLLPHVKGDKTIARQGEIYPVLLMDNSVVGVQPVQIQDSVHFNGNAKALKVGVIEVIPTKYIKDLSKLEKTCGEVEIALNSTDSGTLNARVISKMIFSCSLDNLFSFVVNEMPDGIDLIVVSCVTFDGSFQYHLDVTNILRHRLSKIAKSMSMQARQGAAYQDPSTALFEAVVGYVPKMRGAMLVCVQDNGIRYALSNVRGLIKHGLRLARGSVGK